MVDFLDLQKARTQPQPVQQQGFNWKSLLPAAGGIAAGLASAPLTGGMSLLGTLLTAGGLSALGGAAGKSAQNQLENKNLNEGVGKEALTQGLYGAGGELLNVGLKGLGIGAKASGTAGVAAGSGKVGKAGESLLGSIVKPKVSASPFGAAEEANLVKTARSLGLKGTAAEQYAQLGTKFDEISTKIASDLAKSNAVVSKKSILSSLTKSLEQNFANVDQKAIDTIAKNLTNAADKSGNIAITDLFKYKQSLGNNLKRAFAKLDSPTAVLTAKEETALGAWKEISGAISKAEPTVSAATKTQSHIFDLAPGLAKARNETINIPVLGKVSAAPYQLAKSKVGTSLINAGNRMAQPTSQVMRAGVNAGLQNLGGSFYNALPQTQDQTMQSDLTQPDLTQAEQMGQTTETPTSGVNKDLFTQAIFNDFAQTGGKNVNQIIAVAKFLGVDQETTKKPTAMQAQVGGYANRVTQANQMFDKLEPQVTGGGGVTSDLTSKLSLARNLPERLKTDVIKQQDQAERNFINAVLRRESGAAIAPSEFESARLQYFPQPGDSKAVLAQKRQNRYLVQQNLTNEAQGSSTISNDSIGQLLQQLGN